MRAALCGSVLALTLPAAVSIVVDYPAEGTIFPPEIATPTFLWRDPSKAASMWRVEIRFADGSAPLHSAVKGERLRVGPIDPDCVSPTNEPPRLTARQAASRTWVPDAVTWQAIKRHSVDGPATVMITGYGRANPERVVSSGRVGIRTSKDPVGAPIFYRDVPLMPTGTEKGNIKPLSPQALPLVQWRLRDIGKPQGRVLMENLPVCANCHSFSADGRTMGMDLDGLQNNKGQYFLARVAPRMSVGKQDVIQWSSPSGRLKGGIRIGFMSQVSPDGQYVATTINPAALKRTDPTSNYYVTNYRDYKFLQVFYPTRGFLAWYSRETGVLQPLPGADDRRYVQFGAVWSPDSRYLVFARAEAMEPYLEGAPAATAANDPNERQIRFDLYRIPFNGGRGGVAEPIAGASRNGMSNTFPRVSPDGRWIVFVKCRNGQLMRPDSQLYIVSAAGGQARRMNCNTPLMNSWHSFSPNGRWLVFSSKTRSPYTQMYLTHVDENGNDSPPVLVENATAANRAVNLPEFVNVPADGFNEIDGPAIEYYRLFNRALHLEKNRRVTESIAAWKQVLAISPDDFLANNNLGLMLALAGRRGEAAPYLRQATLAKLRRALAEAEENNRPAQAEELKRKIAQYEASASPTR